MPAVVAIHQTTAMGKDEPAGYGSDTSLAYAAELVTQGYVVLVPDLLMAGERILGTHAWDMAAYPTTEYPTLVGRHVLDTMTCVSYLRSLVSVDRKRISLMGHSQGAITALFAGALDARVSVVAANDGFMTLRQDPNPHRWDRLIPGLVDGVGFDLDEVVALTAPRPLAISSNLEDPNIPQTRLTFVSGEQTIETAYEAMGAAGNLMAAAFSGGHSFPTPQREALWAFMWEHLH